MIKRQWCWNLRETRVFFYEWVERCETGKAWDLLCKKKKCSLKVHSAVWHLFFFFFFFVGWLVFVFVFLSFISSYQVKLGCLDLVWVDCRKFCALFFVCSLRSFFFFSVFFFYFFFSFVLICFFQNVLDFFFFPKSPILEFACWDSLESFSPDFVVVFCFCCCLFLNCFMFKIQFRKRRTSTVRFHSSEFSVSIMHSSLLS